MNNDYNFEDVGDEDLQKLEELRILLDIHTDLPFTVLAVAIIRIKRQEHELRLAQEALLKAQFSLKELKPDNHPLNEAYNTAVAIRRINAIIAVDEALNPYKEFLERKLK